MGFRSCLFSLCFGLLLASTLAAQTSVHGTLRGRIVDFQGLAVQNVEVKIAAAEGGISFHTQTDDQGSYQFARVSPGRYELFFEKSGFRTTSRTGIEVAVNETTVVDVSLAVGQVQETVTVMEAAGIVQTDRVEIGGRVDERRVRELPLNGENFAKLVLLAPGVASGSPNNPAISGARPAANSYTVDGATSNDERGSNGLSLGGGGAAEFSGASPNLVSTEAIQEFSIITSAADATFGRGSGGQVNIITKSGSNSLHGSAYEYFRNNKLDARDFFNYGPFLAKDGSGRSVVPPFKQNLFGATIGGPFVKNKHFFFGSYEGFRQKLEQTASATVPNADLIGLIPGQMGELYKIFYIDRGVVPSAGNPVGSFSPLPLADRNAAIAGGFPAHLFNGIAGDGEAGSVLLSTANTRDITQEAFLVRTDHRFTDKLNVNARYAFAQPYASTNQRAVAGVFEENRRRWQSATAQTVYIFSPNQILEGRASLLRSRINDAPRDPLDPALIAFGIDPQLGLQIRANGTALSTLVIPRTTSLLDNETVPQGSLMHTWTRGNLSLRSGMDLRRIIINNSLYSNASFMQLTGIVGANGIIGSNPNQPEAIVTELNTTIYGLNGGPDTPLRGWRATEQEYFVQADYRLRSNITVNAGLRYSPGGAYSTVGNYMGNLYAVDGGGNPLPGVSAYRSGLQANGVFSVADNLPLFNSDRNNWQPRVGIAWNIRGDGKTVVRAAWGVYADRFFQRLFDFGVLNPPYAHNYLVTFLPFPPGAKIPTDASTPPGGRFVDPGLRNPTTYRFSGAIERRLAAQTSVTVAYSGLRATNLYRWIEPNALGSVPQVARPDSRFGRYRYTDNSADSIYHSLQTFARHRFSKGIDFTVSYTYGKSVDTYSQDVGDNSVRNAAPGLAQFPSLINLKGSPAAGFQGDAQSWVPRPILAERGNSDFDIRHSLAISHVVELPFGRGRRFGSQSSRTLDALVGGWSVAGIVTIRSALPVYLSSGIDYADVGITTSPRPALKQGSIQNVYASGEGFDKTQFFLPKAAADQVLGIPANVTDPYAVTKRNELRGPATQNYDLSAIKRFEIYENWKLAFEANFFNVFNHTAFGAPLAVLSDARFGRITNTLPGTTPRQIQLALKFTF